MSPRRAPWAVVLTLAGCGPVFYQDARSDAGARIDELRARPASADALYQLARAHAYLAKAEEEAADGAYEDAIQLARAAARRDPRAPTRGMRDARLHALELRVDALERAGAPRCAPRMLAVARSELAFARVELRQGDLGRARRHLDEADLHAAAAERATPPERCGARTGPTGPEPVASAHPFSARPLLDVPPLPVRHEEQQLGPSGTAPGLRVR